MVSMLKIFVLLLCVACSCLGFIGFLSISPIVSWLFFMPLAYCFAYVIVDEAGIK